MSTHPIAIIGAGLAGAATAWQLARRGHDVVVLERSTPANDLGSSHGSARILRYTYPDPFYTDLMVEARRGWDELEDLRGERLITPTGSLDYGATRDPAALAAVLAGASVPHELLTAAEASARWAGIAFDGPVLWHEDAGVIDAEESVKAMVGLAVAAGAELREDWAAARVLAQAGDYLVESEAGDTVVASQVVVAAGGWLPALLAGLGLPREALDAFPRIEVRQEQALHFPYRDPGAAWPTFINKRADIQVYGLPGGRDAAFRGQKVAEYNGGRVIGSALEHDRIVDPARRERLVSYVAEALPGLVPEPYAETTCLFTNAPADDFIIDRVGGVTILSPCSGHGAKFAPLLGELTARLVTGADSGVSRFRPLAAMAGA
ncbi:FAD-dependent oxidoreductase [Microbacterium trichothecenolyticum]|uniref:FAD-dependent oxidoreductase n=1 Tax=Microbacterium trichothecenolyticum TaxID=69370 RepID=UPI001C6DE765|nr:FAD-dependent oxidoreductase [Microbacterium trichothecenolyticum]MBW9119554.1 FAD-dependent oxidoreductase [Microbacterium trichothecenolyticum]